MDYNSGDCNSGNYNSGNYNSGDCNYGEYNSGYRNSGDYNSGDYNSGDCNSGNYNSGDHNSGYRNSGYSNSGHQNCGDYNSGHQNCGDYNSGDWNSGSRHVGHFNTIKAEEIYCFNKLVNKFLWDLAVKPIWLYLPSPTTWVAFSEMSDSQVKSNPQAKKVGGYLKTNDMKEEWRKAYSSATEESIQQVRDLPGFDADVFFEITGLDIRIPYTHKEVVINGIAYLLVRKD